MMLALQTCRKCAAGFSVFREDDSGWYLVCTGCGKVMNLERDSPDPLIPTRVAPTPRGRTEMPSNVIAVAA